MQSASTTLYQLPSLRGKFQTLLSKAQLFPVRSCFCRPRTRPSVSGSGMRSVIALSGSSSSSYAVDDGFVTLIEYVGKRGINVEDGLVVLLDHIQYACKRIATLVASPFNSSLGKQEGIGAASGSDRDAPKPLDIVSDIEELRS
ncbi:hypothetical protein Ahy_A03g011820 isoform A [Arachis hypogaea]|uniref:Uncharacterized protein n=1 Tax=Arachis hypogaea TaxID=3818 RepID=A0A445DRT1_ARAHY|nr:hypothetical protein Ahy_A03g011820 isoform A [Arachis hypogaea]